MRYEAYFTDKRALTLLLARCADTNPQSEQQPPEVVVPCVSARYKLSLCSAAILVSRRRLNIAKNNIRSRFSNPNG